MYSLEILALLSTHDTGRRETNTKTQHNTENMGLTKVKVLAKTKQFLVGEDSQSAIHRSTLRISPCCAYVDQEIHTVISCI